MGFYRTLLSSDSPLLQHARDEGNEGDEEGHEAPRHEGCCRGGSSHEGHEGNEGHEGHEEGHEAPRDEESHEGHEGNESHEGNEEGDEGDESNEGHEGHEEVNGGCASCPCCSSAGDMNDA